LKRTAFTAGISTSASSLAFCFFAIDAGLKLLMQ
jgi:hypothetical protein